MNKNKIKLHLGCGTQYKEGYINVDINPNLKVDVCFDMDKEKWPFEDNYFDEVLAWHSIEHSLNYLHVIKELWRVCKPNAKIHIGVPYYSSGTYNLVNPYHNVLFNEHSFKFFDDEHLLGSANEIMPAKFKTEKISFDYFPEWAEKTEAVKEFARKHFLNVVGSMEFILKVVK